MPRMPGAIWQGEQAPVQPDGSRLRMQRYDVFCIHTIVGFAPAHAAHFSVKGDGDILQSRDTAFRSGANLDGNYRVVASENEDHGPAFPEWTGSNVPALTDAQVKSNAEIAAWLHDTHGIPLQLCPDSRPTSRGLAYHRQGIDGNWDSFRFSGRVPGGETWTTSPGKVCPGDRRIARLPEILALAQGDDDMPFTEKQLTDIVENAVAKELASIKEQLDDLDTAHKALVRKLFANLRVILKERFEATDAELDDIIGHLEPDED